MFNAENLYDTLWVIFGICVIFIFLMEMPMPEWLDKLLEKRRKRHEKTSS